MSADSYARTLAEIGLKQQPSTGLSQSLQGALSFDTFDRPNQQMAGSILSSGQTWSVQGTSAGCQIVNGNYVSTNSSGISCYAYTQSYGGQATHIECEFSFNNSVSLQLGFQPLTMALDTGNGSFTNLLHLNFGPTTWTLSGGSTTPGPLVAIGVGNLNLLTDGTVYRIAMDVNYSSHTITVTDPNGIQTVITNGTYIGIASNQGTWGFLEIINSTGYVVGGYSGFAMGVTGPSLGATIGAANLSAPMQEATWLKGVNVNNIQGTLQQRVGWPIGLNVSAFTTGWYTIATQGTNVGFGCQGVVQIAIFDSVFAQFSEIEVDAMAFKTPKLFQNRMFQNYSAVGGVLVDEVRLSTNSGSNLVQLDMHISRNFTAGAIMVIDFYGVFTPVQNPVVGATVLATATEILWLHENTRSLRIPSDVFANAPTNPAVGDYFIFTDSNTSSIGATISGSSSNVVLGFYNHSGNWIVGVAL